MRDLIRKIFGLPFGLKYNKWYKNKRWQETGHRDLTQNVFIILGNKKQRGSFKITKDWVYYLVGWKYYKKKIRRVPLNNCKFKKDEKIFDGIATAGQSGDYVKTTTYIIVIKNYKDLYIQKT